MNSFRYILAKLCLALVIGLLPLTVAQAVDVLGIRTSTDDTRTRAVFDLSDKTEYELFQLANPERIVIDLKNSQVKNNIKLPQNVGAIRSIRTGPRGSNGVRLVLDLKSSAKIDEFLLPAKDGGKDRLVVDIMAPGNSAPTVAKAAAPTDKNTPRPLSTAQAAETAQAQKPAQKSPRKKELDTALLLESARKIVVAIDPGHGGKDPGARGRRGTLEKNITLQVARKLAAQINRQEGMQAVLTRNSDIFVPLQRRYQIAREHNADVFVSIHADAFKNPNAKGSSVWVLSPNGKVSEAARWLADRENRADLLGGVTLSDKSDSLASVLLDLQQSYALEVSETIATNVHRELANVGPTHRTYVEKANFVVLRSPDVPSLLVETGFITNPATENQLRNGAYQDKLAGAILKGVDNYFQAAPPPGTLYAIKAAQKRGEIVSASPGAGNKHRVGRGDTLSGIAQRYGVSAQAIKSANHMTGNVVRTGTVLTIPAS